MAVLQMQRISICALKENRKQILELLQQEGVVELDMDMEEDEVFRKSDTISSRGIFEKNAATLDHALEILQTYVPEKKGMLSSLEGKTPVDYDSYSNIVEKQEAVMAQAHRLTSLAKEIAENKANILKRQNQIEALEPWKNLDVPMNFAGTKKATAFVGTISSVMTQEQIHEGIVQADPKLDAFDVNVISEDKDQTYVCILCGVKDAPALEEALRGIGFARPAQTGGMIPRERQERLEQKIAVLEQKNEELEKEIAGYENTREDLRLASDYYRTRASKYEVLGKLLQSKKTFVLNGYVPTRAAAGLEKKLNENFTLSVEISEVPEEDEAPILLQNNTFSASFEGVAASFGLPGKGEIDPTTIMSFFYFFFFGLMLSDAAYGLIVTVACFIVLKKFPNMELGMKKSIRMFMYCGISTLFWGIMFGGYFGDIVNVVTRLYFGNEVTVPALWFVPLNDPMKLLIWSMGFGLIHLFVGLGMKGYMLIRDKKYLDFFCDVVLWFVFLIGLLMLLIPSSLFASIAQMTIVFPPFLNLLAKVFAIGGAVGICLMSGRDNKNWGLRIALGAYDLYNTTGWLSDVLSYSRLLALGLATGVIASVVNQMGSMIGQGVIGTILFIIIFIFGHTLNLAINLLGAYVHTNRLQFVEFFGKFYEGGGHEFTPFTTNTKYVNIKEEIKL
ncbi:MAG: V-type ATP synthase subunit I [Lachnospiraceae bacterium]|nr:V-type ATP synthase subunit I [Lachnospiraceae bacterium]